MAEAIIVSVIPVVVTMIEEVSADRADLYVTVRGTSLFTGSAALTKAREVGAMVEELKRVGLDDSHILLQGVRAETTGGTFSKSSSVLYDLKIRCPRLALFGEVIGAITGAKNSELRRVRWLYPDLTAKKDDWLIALIEQASVKAKRIAAALGVTLIGVKRFSEKWDDPEVSQLNSSTEANAFSAPARARTVTTADFSVDELGHTKTVTLTVEIQYQISNFAT